MGILTRVHTPNFPLVHTAKEVIDLQVNCSVRLVILLQGKAFLSIR